MLSLSRGILTDYTINGKKRPLNMAYDNVLRWYDLLAKKDINDEKKALITLKMFTGVTVADVGIAVQFFKVLSEYLAQAPYDSNAPTTDIAGNPQTAPKLYDFEADSAAIYAAFMECYGIDLIEQRGRLHWDKFTALLAGLSEKTYFKQIVSIRQRTTAGLEGQELHDLLQAKATFALEQDEQASNAGQLDAAFNALAANSERGWKIWQQTAK